jgi:hypothetical protein
MPAMPPGHVPQMITAGNFAPGNAGVPFFMDILMPLSAITLLFALKPEKA